MTPRSATAATTLAVFIILLAGCSAGDDRSDATSPPHDAPGKDSSPWPDAPAPLPAGLLVLDHVTVVDADGARLGQAVLVHQGAILDVRAAGQAWPADAHVVDGTGAYVVPGLVDAHVHLSYSGATAWVGDPLEANLRGSLYHGVTAVMDVGGAPVLFALRKAIEQGRVVGPTVRATGPFLTEVGSHPCETSPYNDCVFVDAVNAKAQAQSLIDQGADALKVALADTAATPWPGPRLDPTAVGQAAALTVPVVAHVNSGKDILDAMAQGVQILAHPGFVETIGPAAVQAATAARGVQTTIGALGGAPDLVDGKLDLADPGLILGPGVLANWKQVKADPSLLLPGWVQASRGWAANAAANVKALRGAGATLVPASDAGYMFVPHGLGLHRELDRLAAQGWTPHELLTAVTVTARELIGLPGGRVKPGQVADLLLLRQDPQASVAALDAIEAVVLRGVYHLRDDLLTRELQPKPGELDDVCLGPPGCGPGLACDGLAHLCRPSCPAPHVALNACGAGAWCMPRDGLAATSEGVCRPESPCDLYAAGSCGPTYYALTCQPLDADTSGCILAGGQAEGQGCGYAGGGTTCKPGLYCSPIDATCYRLCDPSATDTCPSPSSCQQQTAGGGVGWFGLCL